jgi:hypothetical protein
MATSPPDRSRDGARMFSPRMLASLNARRLSIMADRAGDTPEPNEMSHLAGLGNEVFHAKHAKLDPKFGLPLAPTVGTPEELFAPSTGRHAAPYDVTKD